MTKRYKLIDTHEWTFHSLNKNAYILCIDNHLERHMSLTDLGMLFGRNESFNTLT